MTIEGHRIFKIEWTQYPYPRVQEKWISYVSASSPLSQRDWQDWQSHYVRNITDYSCAPVAQAGTHQLISCLYQCPKCEQWWDHKTWKRHEQKLCPDCGVKVG